MHGSKHCVIRLKISLIRFVFDLASPIVLASALARTIKGGACTKI